MGDKQVQITLVENGSPGLSHGNYMPPDAMHEPDMYTVVSNPEAANTGLKLAKNIGVAAVFGKRILDFTTQNIGKYTCNSMLQDKINNATRVIGYGTAIALNPALGIGMLAFDFGTTIYNEERRKFHEEISLSNARARNGYRDASEITNSRGRK